MFYCPSSLVGTSQVLHRREREDEAVNVLNSVLLEDSALRLLPWDVLRRCLPWLIDLSSRLGRLSDHTRLP